MAFKTVFNRHEIKFIITKQKKEAMLKIMSLYMKPDFYGRSTIRNLYYDTDNYRLVRHSNEKPVYKEKLRVRSYSRLAPGDTVFVELKKKYKSVVYKRRWAMTEREAMTWLNKNIPPINPSQIQSEIEYFRMYYKDLKPKVFLSYDREAFYNTDGSDFRVTFDENILARTDRLSLCEDVGGTKVLDDSLVLMEIKTSGGIPLWMTSFLTENRIYKTSFSKYGRAYSNLIYSGKGELNYV